LERRDPLLPQEPHAACDTILWGNSLHGDINSSTFGHVTRAAAPRISQVAMKFPF
jgi:hypothetical protein